MIQRRRLGIIITSRPGPSNRQPYQDYYIQILARSAVIADHLYFVLYSGTPAIKYSNWYIFQVVDRHTSGKVAGLYWARPQELANTPSKRIMSQPPTRPGLTPQFCFNETALRGRPIHPPAPLPNHPKHPANRSPQVQTSSEYPEEQ